MHRQRNKLDLIGYSPGDNDGHSQSISNYSGPSPAKFFLQAQPTTLCLLPSGRIVPTNTSAKPVRIIETTSRPLRLVPASGGSPQRPVIYRTNAPKMAFKKGPLPETKYKIVGAKADGKQVVLQATSSPPSMQTKHISNSNGLMTLSPTSHSQKAIPPPTNVVVSKKAHGSSVVRTVPASAPTAVQILNIQYPSLKTPSPPKFVSSTSINNTVINIPGNNCKIDRSSPDKVSVPLNIVPETSNRKFVIGRNSTNHLVKIGPPEINLKQRYIVPKTQEKTPDEILALARTNPLPARRPVPNVNRRKQILRNLDDKVAPEIYIVSAPAVEHVNLDLEEVEHLKEAVKSALTDLEWSGNIGTLPGFGSFRINEFGLLELEHSELAKRANSGKGHKKMSTDIMLTCLTCHTHGQICEFHTDKFCSPNCLEKNAQLELFAQKKAENLLMYKKALVEEKNSIKNRMKMLDEKGYLQVKDNDNQRLGDIRMELAVLKNIHIPENKDDINMWRKFVAKVKRKRAPLGLFKEPFPTGKNPFKIEMKMEAIDPVHPSLFCVVTVVDVRGYRIKLHFDGYRNCHDFWVNANSNEIFHAGWCEKTDNNLVPPSSQYLATLPNKKLLNEFNWSDYLEATCAQTPPKHYFTHNQERNVIPSGFRVGMKLEAVDKKNSRLTCVATIANVLENRILVHFDGWADIYDYWVDNTSPYIHPVGWCEENGHHLMPPPDYEGIFQWDYYLHETGALPAPARAFKPRPPIEFRKGMKVEVVDRRNPMLIRVATVRRVDGHQIQIRFEGWSNRYSYWVDDDSPDLHPIGWCTKTGHPLEAPMTLVDLKIRGIYGRTFKNVREPKNHDVDIPDPDGGLLPSDIMACATLGCKGWGHAYGEADRHYTYSACPYVPENMRIDVSELIPSRFRSIAEYERVKASALCKGTKPKSRTKLRKLNIPPAREKKISDKKPPTVSRKRKYEESKISDHDEENDETSSSAPAEIDFIKSEWNIPEIVEKIGPNPMVWTTEQVVEFTQSLDLGLKGSEAKDLGLLLTDELIDGECFLMLTRKDIIKALKLSIGPAVSLHSCIKCLREKAREWL